MLARAGSLRSLLATLSLPLLAACQAPPLVEAPEHEALLDVRVVDPGGAPVSGVTVRVSYSSFAPGPQQQDAPTDALGKATFTLPAPSHLRTAAVLSEHGAVPVLERPQLDLEGRGHHRISLRIPDPGSVVGRLVDAAGAPVADAEVLAWLDRGLQSERNVERLEPDRRARTGADGRFRLDKLGDNLCLMAQAEGDAGELRLAGTVFISLRAGRTVDLGDQPMFPAHRFEGRALRPDGRPLAGAEVHLSAYPPEQQGEGYFLVRSLFRSAETGRDGRFRLELPAGLDWRLRARHEDYPGLQRHLGLDPGPVELRFEPELELSGRVVGPSGSPLSGAIVRVNGADPRTVSTAADGGFRLPLRRWVWQDGRAEANRPSLAVAAPGYASRWIELGPLAPAPAALELRLEAGLRIQGTVIDADGKPVADARVRLRSAVWPGRPDRHLADARTSMIRAFHEHPVRTGPLGGFAIEGLPAGSYLLRALPPRGMGPVAERVVEAGSAPVTILLDLSPSRPAPARR